MSATLERRQWRTARPSRYDLGLGVDEYFTTLGRDAPAEVEAAARVLSRTPLVQEMINAIPHPAAILNQKGQVVLTNRRWDRELDADPEFSQGERHGDLFQCTHRYDGPDGCATAAVCEGCGAATCIVESLQSPEPVSREYHLHRDTPMGAEDVDRHVTAGSIHVDGRPYTLFILSDDTPC